MANREDYEEEFDGAPGIAMRFIPPIVVVGAVAGFFALAWYAYHAGSSSMKEEDLLLIEADKTPIKETPKDPGGMKFPHQDKTIYEAISGESKTPKVERVLPAPEEPMEKPKRSAETTAWVNDKLRKDTEDLSEAEAKKTAVEAPAATPPKTAFSPPASEKPAEIKRVEPEKPVAEAPKVEEKPAPVPEPVEAKAEEKPAPPAKPSGSAKVQLGAYKSEAEARGDWGKIVGRTGGALAGYSPVVVKADLGEKGIFYRLQVHGVENAKSLCARLAASNQACLPAK